MVTIDDFLGCDAFLLFNVIGTPCSSLPQIKATSAPLISWHAHKYLPGNKHMMTIDRFIIQQRNRISLLFAHEIVERLNYNICSASMFMESDDFVGESLSRKQKNQS
jgi:hypothetical protein